MKLEWKHFVRFIDTDGSAISGVEIPTSLEPNDFDLASGSRIFASRLPN